ncbi:hypothetical protein NKI36_06435 [Mesorhizobium caraganae]|uniref:Uncharacterized protein n=1 Tax=Mesorhizobium caraganae TaxID=483206 RepID=A0ABV1YVB1_9HYPH
MTRLVDHRDTSAAEILDCSCEALAIIHLCESAAWAIQNGGNALGLADAIGSGLRLAYALLEPVHEALSSHDGRK